MLSLDVVEGSQTSVGLDLPGSEVVTSCKDLLQLLERSSLSLGVLL